MGLKDLPTLADQPAKACPKPRPRVLDRISYKVERERQASKFRADVWKRDKGVCRLCGRKVARSVDSTVRGHVHHIVPRSKAPERRFDPKNGMLLCAICHHEVHSGKVKVTKP